MHNNNDDLFDLIKSMSKQEKRYFKLYSTFYTTEKSNNYTKLFDAIDKLPRYSDEDLLRSIQAEPFVRHLATVKYQLTQLVLDCLAAFNARKTVNSELRVMLSHVELLYSRGLYRHCKKLLNRIRKKAEQIESVTVLLECLNWERDIMFAELPDSLEESVELHYQKTTHIVARIADAASLSSVRDSFFAIGLRYVILRNPEDIQRLRELTEQPLLRDVDENASLTKKLLQANAWGLYSLLTGDYSEAIRRYGVAIDLWESNEALIRKEPDSYKRTLTDYLTCCIALQRLEEFTAAVKKIRSVPSASISGELTVLENALYLELMYYLNEGKMEQGLQVVREVENGIRKFGDKIRPNRLLTLNHNSSVLYFLCGKYSQTLEHITNILSNERAGAVEDIREFARLFRLIVHYELGDFDTLENVFRSTYRFFKKREAFTEFSKAVIRSVKKLLNSPDNQTALGIHRRLRSDLVKILHTSDGAEPIGLTEVLFWTESKLLNAPLDKLFTTRMRIVKKLSKRELFPLEAPLDL